MPFPEANTRYIYQKNPLKKVICQLRFPPILKIDTDIPAEFQEKIREFFPMYNLKSAFQQEQLINFGKPLPPELINQFANNPNSKNYEFISEDGIWKINLTRTFITLSTSRYTTWEDFYQKLDPAYLALNQIYKPPFFTRIGLRYVDVIDRSELGIKNCEWSKLLQPHIIGLYATNIQESIKQFENIHEIALSDGISKVRIQSSIVSNLSNFENCFSIDSDFYNPQKCTLEKVHETLGYLHSRSTNLLQWIITPKLHELMNPVAI